MTTAQSTKRQIRLIDTETGEVIAQHTYNYWNDDEMAKGEKGWVLRWRTGYKRRTGRRLRAEAGCCPDHFDTYYPNCRSGRTW